MKSAIKSIAIAVVSGAILIGIAMLFQKWNDSKNVTASGTPNGNTNANGAAA